MQATVHFNTLPKSVRERVIEATKDRGPAQPILAERPSAGAMTAGAVVMGIVAAAGIWYLWKQKHGHPWDDGWGTISIGIVATLLLAASWTIFTAIHRVIVAGRLPFTPGVYLIGGDLIDARTPKLRIVPLVKCEPNIIHHHYNGNYQRTEFRFTPPIGGAFVFNVKPRHAAESVLDEIQRTLQLLNVVHALDDQRIIEKVDLFHDLRDDQGTLIPPGRAPDPVEPLAREIPGWIAKPTLLALVIGAVLTVPVWWLRKTSHDDAAFQSIKDSHGDSWAVEAYLRWGKNHVTEAKALLYVKKIEEAEREDSVTALRGFLQSYPDAPEDLKNRAREGIHRHFTVALDKFREVASDDAQTLAFVERLIAFEEQHDSPGLRVEFRPPKTESLAAMDDVLKEMAEGKYDFAPLAPQFGEETAGGREAEIVTNLSSGFRSVFAEDILHLENGGRIEGELAPRDDRATIEVTYEVRPMSDADGPVIYLLDEPSVIPDLAMPDQPPPDDLPTNKRLYMGIEVDFQVTMRVPGHAETRELTLLVQPPERFTVSTGYEGDPTDSGVYSVMTSRAFDQLSERLGSAFFRNAPAPEPGAEGELPPAYPIE
jgi:hypothetical protein